MKTSRGPRKRVLAFIMSAVMAFTLLPTSAFAAEAAPPGASGISECHPEHDSACGYIALVPGQSCGHYDEETGTYTCAIVEDGEDIATPSDADKEYVCGHKDECGYVETAEGQNCSHACELCEEPKDSGIMPVCICTEKCFSADIDNNIKETINFACLVCTQDLLLCQTLESDDSKLRTESPLVMSVDLSTDEVIYTQYSIPEYLFTDTFWRREDLIDYYKKTTYVWYSSNYSDMRNRVTVHNASGEDNSYLPDTGQIGTKYYMCEIWTIDNQYVSSSVAKITVIEEDKNAVINARKPVIQDVHTRYYIQDSEPLVIVLKPKVPDGGTLTYQWYRIDTIGTTPTFPTPIWYYDWTATFQNEYGYSYYCVITNTIPDNGDGGQKTATYRTSTFSVNGIISGPKNPIITKNPPAEITIDNRVNYQMLTVNAECPNATLYYTWFKNSTPTLEDSSTVTRVPANIISDLRNILKYFKITVLDTPLFIADLLYGDKGNKLLLSPFANSSETLYYYCMVTAVHPDGQVTYSFSDYSKITWNIGAYSGYPQYEYVNSTNSYTYTTGQNSEPITISIENMDGTNCAYQWYYDKGDGLEHTIFGATQRSILPKTDVPGKYNYYCEVYPTVFPGDDKYTVTTKKVQVTVNDKVNASYPTSMNMDSPAEVYYIINEISRPITVNPNFQDRGKISYQWWQNSEQSFSLIPGATENSYTPPTNQAGTTLYYCSVTNTIPDNGDGGIKTIHIETDVIEVTVESQVNARTPKIENNLSSYKRTYKIFETMVETLDVTATVSDNGMLSYQWYEITGDTSLIIPGAEQPSYLPPNKLGTSYYCCLVTNTIPQGEDVDATIAYALSGSAAVTFTSVSADKPVIENELISASYKLLDIPLVLDATATTKDGGTLSYQWFSNTAKSSMMIIGATSPTFLPPTNNRGIHYYFCQIKNTVEGEDGKEVAVIISNVATIAVDTQVNVVMPRIVNETNQDKWYRIGADAKPPDATATVHDSGVLTYQWFKKPLNSYTWEQISEATEATYTPSTKSKEVTSYYCQVSSNIPDNGDKGVKFARLFTQSIVITVTNGRLLAEIPNITNNLSSEEVIYSINQPATTLSVEGEVSDGGTLAYQWYSNQVASTGGATAINGATTAAYTPSTAIVGTKYYYCIVNNSIGDDAADAQATSNIAMVTVLSGVSAQTPIIQTDLDTTEIIYPTSVEDWDIKTLNLNAVVTDGGQLTYQWYSNSIMSTEGASKISGATSPTYQPKWKPAGTTTYYYCMVTNTINDNGDGGQKTITIPSRIATIKVTDEILVQKPVIEKSPVDASYTQNQAAIPLSVTAKSLDTGILQYQWYQHTTNSMEGATAISGATNQTYSPPTGNIGIVYYLCRVTNVIPENHALRTSVDSGFAKITVNPKQLVTFTSNFDNQPYTGYGYEPSGRPLTTPNYTGILNYTYYNGTNATGTPLIGTPKNAGIYTVLVSIPENDPLVEGSATFNFTITKVKLTVRSNDAIMNMGETLPLLTYSCSGFVGQDNASNVFSTMPVPACDTNGSIPGTFPINFSKTATLNNSAGQNYTLTYLNGSLTVKERYKIIFNNVDPAITISPRPNSSNILYQYNAESTTVTMTCPVGYRPAIQFHLKPGYQYPKLSSTSTGDRCFTYTFGVKSNWIISSISLEKFSEYYLQFDSVDPAITMSAKLDSSNRIYQYGTDSTTITMNCPVGYRPILKLQYVTNTKPATLNFTLTGERYYTYTFQGESSWRITKIYLEKMAEYCIQIDNLDPSITISPKLDSSNRIYQYGTELRSISLICPAGYRPAIKIKWDPNIKYADLSFTTATQRYYSLTLGAESNWIVDSIYLEKLPT